MEGRSLMRKLNCLLVVLFLAIPLVAMAEKPALVVLISVDQLRGDMPQEYRDRFVEGGFRRFFDAGVVYPNAHFGHTTTYTASGHATLATGGNPREHGLIGNSWIDAATGDTVYCVQDTEHTLLGANTSRTSGTSPKNMLSPTIGDALIDATDGEARVFSVSRKDRSAILMGGHKGKAYWFDGVSGRYITSTYYHDEYPAWITRWNDAKPADAYAGGAWTLLRDRATYTYRDQDEREAELTHPVIGETFPHSFEGLEGRSLYGVLNVTPFSDSLTVDIAQTLIREHKLGRGSATDFLAVGLSATDGVGHAFGPYSLEAEDNVLRVDLLLSEFFEFLEEWIGMDKVVVALSADHGVDGNPPGQEMGIMNSTQTLEAAKAAVKNKYGADADYVGRFSTPYVYFTPEALALPAEKQAEVEAVIARALRKVDGVAYAISKHQIVTNDLDGSPVMQRVRRSFHPDLSGSVFVIQDEYHRIASGRVPYTATHGTPYGYDTHVPVMFLGPGIPNATVDRAVGPESIAATLAALLGIEAPSGATGPVLSEVTGE